MEGKNKKATRTVTEKIEGAEKGHLGDMFEVAGWMELGRYSLNTDKAKAQEYYDGINENLQTKRPFFSSLELINYKGIRKTVKKITLDPYLNIFVGVNGSGKTTIIESIVKASTWLVNGIKNRANGKGILPAEINNSQDAKDCAITATLTLDEKSTFTLILYKNKSSTNKNRSSLSEFKNLAEMYYSLNSKYKGESCLPLFCHYSVSRALEIKTDDEQNNGEITAFNNLDGYSFSFEESRNFKSLIKWMLFCGSQNNDEVDDIKNKLSSLEVKYNTTYEIYNFLADETKEESSIGLKLKKELDELRIKIAELQLNLNNVDGNIVSIVKKAIYKFMSIDNIRMKVDKDNVSILLDKKGITISATDLSQGEKALFSLVSDISRRLILLNPGKGINALKGHGVVIIDEIDLHLHPKWQQEIIGQLQDTFPNIQFIITTHSPQVLSTAPSHCIKVIRNDENGMLNIVEPEFSLGSESDMILEDIFLVNSRPENIEQVKMLNRYKDLIELDKWDTDEAKELKEELDKWAGKHDPVMKKLQMDIRLREFRRGKK
ncbi:retron Ec78 anti-phage system effector ATPase PtuA [Hafnia paralvei]|uniref:retron Ec78 anti-phage system effector ATPase PtuA n=1 Tax=Hafnia paralvei TaxID=546367 RepID=UPI001034D07D|nr:retron Ec78 anti-phage system effector ATPase PtuA [Hafnia paralvei]TBL61149.1 chromosome segregation protein SMC [Hafnia paralvei]